MVVHYSQKETEQQEQVKKPEQLTSYSTNLKALLSTWNLFEFKMMDEAFTFGKLYKLLGYFGLFCEHQAFLPDDLATLSTWLIFTRKPRKLFAQLVKSPWQLTSLSVPGFYELAFLIPIRFVVISELPLEEDYLPFLLFSSDRQLDRFLNYILETKNKLFIRWSYLLYKEELLAMAKSKDQSLDKISQNVRNFILDMGLKNFVDLVGIKEFVEAVGLEELIKTYGREEVIKVVGLEEVIKIVGLEKLIKVVGLEKLIKVIGVEEVIKIIGKEELLSKIDSEELERILEKRKREEK